MMPAKINLVSDADVDTKWLTGLDLLRFILAIIIVIFHFPHFDNIHFADPGFGDISTVPLEGAELVLAMNLPLKNILAAIYVHGDFAVRIFWMISGIIFSFFYLDKIQNQEISIYNFLFLRFSRLYPLHLITLIAMAVLHYVYFQKFGDFFIYKNNTPIHFFLNLFMINYWNASFGYSFNGPFWSVSIEMFIYIVFYVLAFLKSMSSGNSILYITLIALVFHYLEILSPFNEGMLYFFAGCFLVNCIRQSKKSVIMGGVLLFLILLVITYSSLYPFVAGIGRLMNAYIQVFTSFIVILAFVFLFKKAGHAIQKSFRVIGNMTYAIYMIHISVQAILILFFYERGVSFFMNPTFLITYIFICCILGYFAFRYIERPAQNLLRGYKKNRLINQQPNPFLNAKL